MASDKEKKAGLRHLEPAAVEEAERSTFSDLWTYIGLSCAISLKRMADASDQMLKVAAVLDARVVSGMSGGPQFFYGDTPPPDPVPQGSIWHKGARRGPFGRPLYPGDEGYDDADPK